MSFGILAGECPQLWHLFQTLDLWGEALCWQARPASVLGASFPPCLSNIAALGHLPSNLFLSLGSKLNGKIHVFIPCHV